MSITTSHSLSLKKNWEICLWPKAYRTWPTRRLGLTRFIWVLFESIESTWTHSKQKASMMFFAWTFPELVNHFAMLCCSLMHFCWTWQLCLPFFLKFSFCLKEFTIGDDLECLTFLKVTYYSINFVGSSWGSSRRVAKKSKIFLCYCSWNMGCRVLC